MDGNKRFAAAALALITWAGLLLQLYLSLRLSLANGKGIISGFIAYTGFFTILTNLFIALVMTVPLLAPRSRAGAWFARQETRGMAVTAIVVVGVVYHVLLRNVWNPQGLQKVADIILHYVVPSASLAFWIAFPPSRVSWSWPFNWCVYPLVYFVYALVRGSIIDSYPYYFINVPVLGAAAVLRNAAAMSAAFVVAGALVTWAGTWRGARR